MPVTDHEDHFVGSVTDSNLLGLLIENPEIKNEPIKEVMDNPFQFVALNSTLDVLSSLIDKDNKALLVRDESNRVHIITQQDLLLAISS